MRQPVPLPQAYRLLNHGPTVLVSAAHGGQRNLMAAAWAMPLDFDPPKVAVVVDRSTFTRGLIEASGSFALQVPCAAQADLVTTVGNTSGRPLAEAGTDKFVVHGIGCFDAKLIDAPLVDGCVAWLECRVIAWPDLQRAHDLFLAEVVAAQADDRVFSAGRWHFDRADAALRTLHHTSGGAYLLPGEAVLGRVIDPK
ncbi:flavin reductase family protein [Ideonella sp. A 288]|uniref:flavin reductase family protein n=1 Tax=Ideonella sp. A 288 TaxID=1962181 RepID=UPI000B4AE97C|nr:flavin reductase family protein [Ideonella sp. A 288]